MHKCCIFVSAIKLNKNIEIMKNLIQGMLLTIFSTLLIAVLMYGDMR